MGILGSALAGGLSGLAKATGDIAEIQYKKDVQLDLQKELEEIKMNKELALAKAKQEMITQNGQKLNSEVDRIAEESVAPKRGLINQNITDKAAWDANPENQKTVDMALQAEKEKSKNSYSTYAKASMNLGQIDDAIKFGALDNKETPEAKLQRELMLEKVKAGYRADADAARFAQQDKALEKRLDAMAARDKLREKDPTLMSTPAIANSISELRKSLDADDISKDERLEIQDALRGLRKEIVRRIPNRVAPDEAKPAGTATPKLDLNQFLK